MVTPYIPASARLAELSPRALILGMLLGAVFGASSLYLVLKVGLTVSASIPVAVISLALFRGASKLGARDATILENNIVQTAGSAGESIAFGLGVTLPAILILGFELEWTRILLVAMLGSLLGILLMIPLRRHLIVIEHRELKYPEGTACAEVLKAAASADSRAAAQASASHSQRAGLVFAGFLIGLAYKTANVALKGWKDVVGTSLGGPLKGGALATEVSPELIGVGYIIGPKIAATMAAGGLLSFMVLAPMIRFFGEGLPSPLAPGTKAIAAMSDAELRAAYILYIGAGAVAAGGIIGMARALPTIWRSLAQGMPALAALARRQAAPDRARPRTEDEIPLPWVLIGALMILVAITLAPSLHMNVLGAALILVFGFLFATVSARLTGQIGSSSNPVSGMTVATLLATCLIFLFFGWSGGQYYVTALSVGAIVCIAASNAGTTAQDLKTGHLVGATPRMQQYAIIAGALTSALILGPVLLQLNRAATVYVPAAQVAPQLSIAAAAARELPGERLAGPQARDDSRFYRVWHKTDAAGGPPGKYLVDDDGRAAYLVNPGINGSHGARPDGTEVRKFDAPKAVLMSYIIKGILDRQLPWGLVLFGVMIAVVLELAGIASLPFAVGVYLPLSSSAPILAGGLVRHLADRRRAAAAKDEAAAQERGGTLLASGYIAGGALAGIVIAFVAGVLTEFDQSLRLWAERRNPFYSGPAADWLSLLPFLLLAAILYRAARR